MNRYRACPMRNAVTTATPMTTIWKKSEVGTAIHRDTAHHFYSGTVQ